MENWTLEELFEDTRKAFRESNQIALPGLFNEMARRLELCHTIIYHAFPDKFLSPFICGHGSEHSETNLPEFLFVCPELGSDIVQIYAKI